MGRGGGQHEVACALVRGAPPQLTRAASGGDGFDLERRIAELERQLADMRSQRQYWNAKAEDQAALVALLERQLAEAEGRRPVPDAVEVMRGHCMNTGCGEPWQGR
jgi:hypothetical protein